MLATAPGYIELNSELRSTFTFSRNFQTLGWPKRSRANCSSVTSPSISAIAVILGRLKLDARIQNHFRRAAEFFSDISERNTQLFFERHLPFENWRGPGHSCARKQCRVNTTPRRVREGNPLPMREFAC